MAASYLPYEPKQQLLVPPALQEWLPEGHLAYYIGDTVDTLDLSAFDARYEKGGPRNQPFNPAMMVKVLIYAYATGVFSSRKIARRLHEDVAFRVLAAGNFPAHRTISDFRALHLKEYVGPGSVRAPARGQALKASRAQSSFAVRAVWRHGSRGSAAPGVFGTGAKRPDGQGVPV